jgi:hypothetical protein
MRFEPPDFRDPDEKKEIQCFRVAVSHLPIVLYLSFNFLLLAAYFFGKQFILPVDPYSLLMLMYQLGWTCSVIAFLYAGWTYLYHRVDVTTERIAGRHPALFHRHFDIELKDVLSIRVYDRFFAGPLGYGKIVIRTKTRGVRLHFVREPRKVEKALRRLIEDSKSTAGRAG